MRVFPCGSTASAPVHRRRPSVGPGSRFPDALTARPQKLPRVRSRVTAGRAGTPGPSGWGVGPQGVADAPHVCGALPSAVGDQAVSEVAGGWCGPGGSTRPSSSGSGRARRARGGRRCRSASRRLAVTRDDEFEKPRSSRRTRRRQPPWSADPLGLRSLGRRPNPLGSHDHAVSRCRPIAPSIAAARRGECLEASSPSAPGREPVAGGRAARRRSRYRVSSWRRPHSSRASRAYVSV